MYYIESLQLGSFMEPKQSIFGGITSFIHSIGKKSADKSPKEANIKEKTAKFSPNSKELASTQIKESKSKLKTEDIPISLVHDAEISGSLLNSQKLYKDSQIAETTIDMDFFGGLYSEEENPKNL